MRYRSASTRLADAVAIASIVVLTGWIGFFQERRAERASDMILTDDNFASIIAAVSEGRGIFDNIRKTLVYLP